MPATVYPNTKNSASSSQTLSPENKHPLHLQDTDRIDITQQFIRQVTSCCLSSRMSRIVLAIFSQTLDFNKFEDDMNGTRLQQLTNIFPHHANEAVRGLEAINALITREGKYGKYMSINFDFEQWGEGDCDKYPINDPHILLDSEEDADEDEDASSTLTPEEYEQLADYEKRELDDFLSGKTANEIVNEPAKTTPIPNEKANEKSQAQWQAEHEQLLQIINDLTTKLRELEAQVKSLLEERAALAKAAKIAKATQKSKTVPVVVTEPKMPPEERPEVPSETDNVVVEEAIVVTKPEPETNIAVQSVVHQPEIIQTTTQATPSSEPITLHFPSQLNEDERYDAEKLVRRAGDKAQILLDLLAKRLRNTADPVKSPIAYLNNLLIRLKTDRLDMPSTTTRSIASAEPRPIRESEVRRVEYQEAVADCIHMENNINLMAKQDNLSFDECLNKLNLNELWETIKDRFYATKEALAAIQSIGAEPV